MEPTEINEPLIPGEPTGMILTEEAQYFLHQSAKWAKFLGILGFVGSAFIALMGVFFGTIMTTLSQFNRASPMPPFMGGAMGVFYILMAAFNFFLALYLYQFGVRVKNGVEFKDSEIVSDGLGKLKSLFKLSGITAIVFLSLYALVIVGLILGAVIGIATH